MAELGVDCDVIFVHPSVNSGDPYGFVLTPDPSQKVVPDVLWSDAACRSAAVHEPSDVRHMRPIRDIGPPSLGLLMRQACV